jgi:hypothetical protein
MPYIKESNRQNLDECISNMVICIKQNASRYTNTHLIENGLSNEEFATILGDINYVFSRVLAGLMKDPSYNKIAMITGVIENIKQEFYRRVASSYEDKKIIENGDIKEYKKLI